MPPEPTKPIEPEVIQEPISEPTSEPVILSEPVIEPVLEPVVETPISEPVIIVPEPIPEPAPVSEPVSSPPAKGEMPEAEGVEPVVEAPISEPVIIPEPIPEVVTPQEPKTIQQEPLLEPAYIPAPVIAPPIEPKLDSFHINMARARELLVKARYVIQLNKKKKIDKIMGLFLKKTKVTNREVRDLLRLSHDMVNIYMNVLIKEGKIKREGKSSATHYTKL